MKEHRTRALKVATAHCISGKKEDSNRNRKELFGSLQVFQLELITSQSHRNKSIMSTTTTTGHHNTNEMTPDNNSTNTTTYCPSYHRLFAATFTGIMENSKAYIQQEMLEQEKAREAMMGCLCPFHRKRVSLIHQLNAFNMTSPTICKRVFDSQPPTALEIACGNVQQDWDKAMRDLKAAIGMEKSHCTSENYKTEWSTLKNLDGNTAVLVMGQKLLKEGEFTKAIEFVKMFLDEGANVNQLNDENRSLLSYSVQYMDESLEFTIFLLNYGATVWNIEREDQNRVNNNYGNDNGNNSAFTWFLRTIIRKRKLEDQCMQTLHLLAEVMSGNPQRMHSHVMSTMFSHAKCYNILGPVFLKIKLTLSPYWVQPKSLLYICRSAVREQILEKAGQTLSSSNTATLPLPDPLQSYLMFHKSI